MSGLRLHITKKNSQMGDSSSMDPADRNIITLEEGWNNQIKRLAISPLEVELS